jgi:hypothetical protein
MQTLRDTVTGTKLWAVPRNGSRLKAISGDHRAEPRAKPHLGNATPSAEKEKVKNCFPSSLSTRNLPQCRDHLCGCRPRVPRIERCRVTDEAVTSEARNWKAKRK